MGTGATGIARALTQARDDSPSPPYPSAAAFRANASSADAIPPCAADQATGFSRKRRTSDSAESEKYGRSLQASSTSHQVHRLWRVMSILARVSNAPGKTP